VGAKRGTRRRRARGSKNPKREASPGLGRPRRVAQAARRETGARAAETRSGSEGEANSRRGSPEALVAGVRSHEENPEVVPNGEGGARKATSALLGRHHETLKGTRTSRESGRVRVNRARSAAATPQVSGGVHD